MASHEHGAGSLGAYELIIDAGRDPRLPPEHDDADRYTTVSYDLSVTRSAVLSK